MGVGSNERVYCDWFEKSTSLANEESAFRAAAFVKPLAPSLAAHHGYGRLLRHSEPAPWDEPLFVVEQQCALIIDAGYSIDTTPLKVLDLGCGVLVNKDAGMPGTHQPWFCRALHVAGYAPIGMDAQPGVEREDFDGRCRNLRDPRALDDIASESIDIVTARALFDSPYLLFSVGFDGGSLLKTLRPQVQRVLRPGGAFIYSAPNDQ